MTPAEFAVELDATVAAALQHPSQKSDKWVEAQAFLGRALGVEGDAITIKKVGAIGDAKNRVGEVFAKSNEDIALCVFAVEGDDTLAQTVLTFARRLCDPTPWVRVIAVAQKKANAWRVTGIFGPRGSKLALALGTLASITIPSPDVEVRAFDACAPELESELYLDRKWVDDVLWMLRDRRALALYGPPGTGKTFIATSLAKKIQPRDDLRTLVQLHPSYGYEDFFEGYRPTSTDSGIGLRKLPGPLRTLATRAAAHPDEPAVLVLDEMNRGNLPRVFGELYLLLEYRDRAVNLMYSPDDVFTLPKNLYVIGSMNTADRSIAVLDQALRRRFHFAPLFPGEQPVEGMLERFLKEHRPNMVWVSKLLEKANKKVGDRNVAIGPSHFMRKDLDDNVLSRVWEYSVLPSIEEQFFGNATKLAEFKLDTLAKGVRPEVADGSAT